jgi:tRNA modification GTPase
MTLTLPADTICAVATPAGRGGVGIIRVSGTRCVEFCARLTGFSPVPRQVQYAQFRGLDDVLIDTGVSLFFQGPHSFTGEDVWELQTHGSPVVLDQLLSTLIQLGCRLARPGEFSERAFLNDKLDLAQAEAIADLIDSRSTAAARNAVRSLQGEFSRLITALVDEVTQLRVFVEAAIDFPDEDVNFLASGAVQQRLAAIRARLDAVQEQARHGVLLREGIHIVIAGEPNAGKSTLLNALAGMDAAIVTDVPGTTRDVLRQEITIAGVPVHILDTAGLRDSSDPVEQEGIRRARSAIAGADRVLLVVDVRARAQLATNPVWRELQENPEVADKLTIVFNKADLAGLQPTVASEQGYTSVCLSAKRGEGLELLRQHILDCAGFHVQEEGGFLARRRHLDALQRAAIALAAAAHQLEREMGELVAEELRRAQDALGEITGAVSADDLLGKIFSTFCIGK